VTPETTTAAAAPPHAPPAPVQTDWAAEARSIGLLILAVLGFHSLIAKPFYIPSESMMPGLLVGDRLIVTKYPYGWSWVSATFHLLPPMQGRIMAHLPERGDVVIVTPPGSSEDYIKRVIGLPGDRLEVRGGTVILNDIAVKREERGDRRVAVDANQSCDPVEYPGRLVRGAGGIQYCQLPIVRETLPNGRTYDTIDLGYDPSVDDFAAITIPADHVFLMGDNRDRSADSRVSLVRRGLGGPVPFENVGGRAEFITFSFDGSGSWWNPISWVTSLRSGRAGHSLHPDREAL
jgi:signal peptidase I